MSSRCKQMALDDVQPGMVLGEDLLTPRGKMILPKGTELTETTLASLHRYEEVQTLSIQLSDAMLAQEEAAERDRFEQRIARLFRHSDQDKAATLLRQHVTLFRLGSKS